MRFFPSLLAALPLACGVALSAAPQAQLVELISARQIDFATVDPVYRQSISRDGGIDQVLAQLDILSKDAARPKRERANALLVASHLQWRFGLREAAQVTVQAGLGIEVNSDLALQQARLLEAAGEQRQAQHWYDRAFALTADPRRRQDIRLRMTFVEVGQRDVEALVRLAQGRDRDFRNRVAVALALLNRHEEATGLYQLHGEGGDRFRQHLRLAQWALESGDAAGAQAQAWQAVQMASLDRDRRYALSVLVDAHEIDDSLDVLLKRLEQKGRLCADEQDIRIDLLQKLRRYDEAIGLLRVSTGADLAPAARRRLLRMYSDGGHGPEMVAEYRRLMAAEPHQVAWFEGLAQYLMEQDDRAAAMQVWREFIDRNSHAGALLAGAQAMVRFGLDELAVAAADKCAAVDTSAASKALMFRFELYLRRGNTQSAEAALADMDRLLAPDSPERVELAEAYERIRRPTDALRVLERLGRSRAGGLDIDERMRTAWLYDSTGQRDKALGVWKSLWNGQLKDALRRLVEDRLMTLAAESGALGDLVVELETRLADGTASEKDSSLLIRIYTEANDPASAVEVIREYFHRGGRTAESGAQSVESLREQAKVYRALGRGKAYRAIASRLVKLDPQRKVDYLQSLVLSQLESGGDAQDHVGQLKEWLTQLRGAGTGAMSAEFEAGILVLANMEEQAISIYRHALAVEPGHGDNYLQLADLLKKRSREAEAIGMLQYLVETASQDDAFVIGVDGILNVTSDRNILEWTQRRVLERLTARGDKPYLYELLGELAGASENTGLYFSALENSLVYASSHRSGVLRELVAASAGKSAAAAAGPQDPALDPADRNLRYSRRLVALGEELPPEVYMDLGRALLGRGDVANAADAFSRAVDRTGDAGLLERIGDLYRDEGLIREARLQYQRALISDTDNAEVMRKLADMRVREGSSDAGGALYARALMDVLKALPQEVEKVANKPPPAFDNTLSYEYRENYNRLLAGFLYTLSPERESFRAMEQAFVDVLHQSMRDVSGRAPKELVYYPRLNAFSRFLREAAQRGGHAALADEVEGYLAHYFDDAHASGAHPVARDNGIDSILPSKAAVVRARERGAYALAAVLAQYFGDQALALSVYREWVKQAITDSTEGAQNPGPILIAAHQKLDAAGFASFSRYVVDIARDRPEYRRRLLHTGGYQDRSGSAPLLEVEKAAGRAAMSDSEFNDLMNAAGASGPQQPYIGMLDMAYVKNRLARLPAAALLELFERSMADARNYPRMFIGIQVFSAALSKPLDAVESARLFEALKKGIEIQMALKNSAVRGWNMGAVNNPLAIVTQLQRDGVFEHLSPANAGFVEELDAFLAASQPSAFTAGSLKVHALIATGREAEALALIVEVALARAGGDDSSRATAYLRTFSDAIYVRRRGEFMALIQAREKVGNFTPATFNLLSAAQDADPQSNPGRRRQWLESMAQRYPDEEPVLLALSRQHDLLGYTDRHLEALERLVRVAPLNTEYRLELFRAWKRLDNPVNAVASAGDRIAEVARQDDSTPEAENPDLHVAEQVLKPAAQKLVDQVRAVETGGSLEQARAGLRGFFQQLPPPGSGTATASVMRQYSMLFNLDWQPPAPVSASRRQAPIDSFMGDIVQQEPVGDPRPRGGKFLDRLIDYEFAIAEFEALIRTLRLEDINGQHPLYSLLAEAYVKHGRLHQALADLTTRVRSGEAGGKERVLWLELLYRSSQAEAAAQVPLLEKTIDAMGAAYSYEQLLLARVYARAGHGERAADVYAATLLTSMASGSGDSLMHFGGNRVKLLSATGLYADAVRMLDAASLERFVKAILTLAQPPNPVAAKSGTYEKFVMWMLEHAPRSQVLRTWLKTLVHSADAGQLAPDTLVHAASVLAQQGEHEAALKLVELALQDRPQRQANPLDPAFSLHQQLVFSYRASLGLPGDESAPRSGIGVFRRLFPANAQAWPGALEWTRFASTRVAALIGKDGVDREQAIELLGMITLRLHQMDERGSTLASARLLSGHLQSPDDISQGTLTLAVAVLEHTQAPVDAVLLRRLIELRRVDVRLLEPVLRRVAATDGAAKSLELGQLAVAYTYEPRLLQLLKSLATEVGDPGLAQVYADLEQQSAQANQTIATGSGASH